MNSTMNDNSSNQIQVCAVCRTCYTPPSSGGPCPKCTRVEIHNLRPTPSEWGPWFGSDTPPTIAEGFGLLFLRLFMGAAIAAVLLAAGMFIAFFSGGGKGLFVLVWFAIIGTPIWALVPLCRAIAARANK